MTINESYDAIERLERSERIEATERSIASAKSVADVVTSLARLKSNRDFKSMVLKGYFEEEAIRLVHLKSAPSMQSVDDQRALILQIDAIGCFSNYLNTLLAKATMASKTLEDDAASLAELYTEQGNE
jgi:hypothetical protein